MLAPDLASAVPSLKGMVGAARVIVPFTGAGISTECGIPDFRSPGGIWTKNRPIPFEEFLASQEARNESWRRRFAMGEEFGHAQPGRGHQALASLYRAGKVPAVVTQNIDNLHQAAGMAPNTSSNCTATRLTRCASIARSAMSSPGCGRAWKRKRVRAHRPDCGGFVKTATISFGQAMPDAAMRRARELTLSCDLFLAIGSSLVVWPAADFR